MEVVIQGDNSTQKRLLESPVPFIPLETAPQTRSLLDEVQSQCDLAKKQMVQLRELMRNGIQPSERETLEICFESVDILSQNVENLKLALNNTIPPYGSFHSLCSITLQALSVFITSIGEYIAIQSNNVLWRWKTSTKSIIVLMSELKESCISLASLYPIFQLFADSVKIPGQSWDDDAPLCFSFDEAERKAQGLYPFWYAFDPKLQTFGRMLISTFATMAGVHQEGNIWGLSSALKIHLWNTWQENMKFTQTIHKKMTIELLQKIWNLPDKSIVKFYEKVAVLQEVYTSEVFQIPFNNTTLKLKTDPKLISIRVVYAKPYQFKFLPNHNDMNNNNNYQQQSYPHHSIKKNTSQSKFTQQPQSFPNIHSNQQQELPKSSNQTLPGVPVIFHIHGGGFVSGSSAMHESYLRNWAHSTGAVIFSIDYKLAPEYQFPVGLYECFQAYQWINQEKNIGFKIGKIIITGDSAGGNISCGLMNLIIMHNKEHPEHTLKMPSGILLAYPVVDFCLTVYPSRLLYYNDPLVPFAASSLCLKAYVPEGEDPKNPLLSPIYTPIEILEKYPKTVILVAEYDPLSDEGVVFGEKLFKIGKNCLVESIKGVPHGFLSLGKFVPVAQFGVERSAKIMKDIFKS